MSVTIHTFGCRLNAYESEVMRDKASGAGLEDVIIFNSCAVTKEAERQLRQAIRRARKDQPDAQIIVTGCAAQISPDRYAAMPEVNMVLGNEEKLQDSGWNNAAQYFAAGAEKDAAIFVNDIGSVHETASHLVAAFDGHTRAFVQVQNGCDHRCTFCIIPYGRGPSRSVPIGEVVNQVRVLVARGTKEVVLTGVDISSYGQGLPGEPTLGQLCKRLLAAVPELPRLRISSIDAAEADADLLRLIAEEKRLMPHLHLSLQAGDNMILKRMKRRHNREESIRFCRHLRELRPDMVLGADLIAGFPTESDAMFEQTLALVDEAELTYLHVFPYSEREGTPAARMPQVDPALRKERAARLRQLGKAREQRYYQSWVGKNMRVLMESGGQGRSEHFVPVACNQAQAGALITVQAERFSGQALEARVTA